MSVTQREPMHREAGEELEFYRGVKINGSGNLVYADDGESRVGFTLNPGDGREKYDSGEMVAFMSLNAGGTRKVEVAAAVSANAYAYPAADGKMDDAVSGEVEGIFLQSASGAGEIIEMLPYTKVGNLFSSIDDSNGNEAIDISATASAVNHVDVTNAATGSSPQISAVGEDTDIDLVLAAKGAGALQLAADESLLDSNGNELLKVSATATAVNEVTLTNAATGDGPEISATGGDDNINLKLSPKGTGRLELGAAYDETGDGMTADPESGTEDGFLQVTVNGSNYQIPIYSA